MAKKYKHPNIDVIVTVFNEKETVRDLIFALKKQTLIPHEVVIVDGGSEDKTFQILQKEANLWSNLHVYQVKGNRSVGRNFAVSKTSAKIIAFTDAGCTPQPNWLEELVKPFSDPGTKVVSGYYKGKPENIFQKCLIPYVLVMPDKAGRTEFFPSTRSMAMRREAWDKSGGFDTKLNHNEDYAYAHWLKKIGLNFVFAREAVVNWIPRKNLKAASWMFMRFAIGDVQAGIIRPKVKMLFIRYLIFVYLLLLALEIRQLLPLIILICFMYLVWSIRKNYRYVKDPMALFWLPVLQVTADASVIFGTLTGLMAKFSGLF